MDRTPSQKGYQRKPIQLKAPKPYDLLLLTVFTKPGQAAKTND